MARMTHRVDRPLTSFSLSCCLSCGMRPRDVFPIPCLEVPPIVSPGLSRVCRQRCSRRRAVVNRANDAISALNLLWDPQGRSPDPLHPRVGPSAAGSRIHQALSRFSPNPGSHCKPAEEAVRQLLGSSLDYAGGEAMTTLGSFDRALVALPSSRTPPQSICSMLDRDAIVLVKDFEAQLLNSCGPLEGTAVVPYVDPALIRSASTYEAFVGDLFDRHLIGFTQSPATLCGAFFVKKSKGGLRFIVDARPANQKFKPPPSDAARWFSKLGGNAVSRRPHLAHIPIRRGGVFLPLRNTRRTW